MNLAGSRTAGVLLLAGLFTLGAGVVVLLRGPIGSAGAQTPVARDRHIPPAFVSETSLQAGAFRPRLHGRLRSAPGIQTALATPPTEHSPTDFADRGAGVSTNSGRPCCSEDDGAADGLWPGEVSPDADLRSGRHASRGSPGSPELYWLKARQSPDGTWRAGAWNHWLKGKRVPYPDPYASGLGNPAHDIGITGLALSAFLSTGYTHRGKHPFKLTVSRGLRYLKSVQDEDGCFGPRDDPRFIHDHALASLAMLEAYAMTHSPIFKRSTKRALAFIVATRHKGSGWGYTPRAGTPDTFTTALMLLPVMSAQLGDADLRQQDKPPLFAVDPEVLQDARRFLRRASIGRTGRVAYKLPGAPLDTAHEPGEHSSLRTAAGVLAEAYAGGPARDNVHGPSRAWLLNHRIPVWAPERESVDVLSFWFGVMAANAIGGKTRKAWQSALRGGLPGARVHARTYEAGLGSWDPVGVWGHELGRVGTTAIGALCLSATWSTYEAPIYRVAR